MRPNAYAGTKRCETYQRELLLFWANRGVTPEVVVVPWADVVPRDGHLDDLPAFDRRALVRLESPGKDERVLRLLLEAGARDDPAEPPCDWAIFTSCPVLSFQYFMNSGL